MYENRGIVIVLETKHDVGLNKYLVFKSPESINLISFVCRYITNYFKK